MGKVINLVLLLFPKKHLMKIGTGLLIKRKEMKFKTYVKKERYKIGQKVRMVSHKKNVPDYEVTIKKISGEKVQVEYIDLKGKKHIKKINLIWLDAFHKRIGESRLQNWINELETHEANKHIK